MDASPIPLVFSQPHGAAAFAIVMGLGLVAASGWWLLRPWPPRAWRGAMFGALVLAFVPVFVLVLQKREVTIDVASRSVVLNTGALGWTRAERWSFEQVEAVTVTAMQTPAAPVFTLSLRVADAKRPVELRSVDEAVLAEDQARALSTLGPWPAVRSGYRLVEAAHGGRVDTFETTAGKKGVVIDLGEFLRVVVQPGPESVIAPLPESADVNP